MDAERSGTHRWLPCWFGLFGEPVEAGDVPLEGRGALLVLLLRVKDPMTLPVFHPELGWSSRSVKWVRFQTAISHSA